MPSDAVWRHRQTLKQEYALLPPVLTRPPHGVPHLGPQMPLIQQARRFAIKYPCRVNRERHLFFVAAVKQNFAAGELRSYPRFATCPRPLNHYGTDSIQSCVDSRIRDTWQIPWR